MNILIRRLWPSVLAMCLTVPAFLAGGCARKGSPSAKAATMAIDLGGGVKIEMVRIPPGEFFMGGTEQDLEKPVHRVKLTGEFWLGRYEVTQDQWTKVMGTNPSTSAASGEYTGSNPVDKVSWKDCQEFVAKLNRMLETGKSKLTGGGEFRLPTEAEWEYACRAGTTTRFYSGERDADLDGVAWYVGNSSNMSHRVGSLKANAFGLFDMHGNVWEWCEDWYGVYPTNALTVDPLGPPGGRHRVVRGGAWCCGAASCRSAIRSVILPGVRAPVIGLRLAMVQSASGDADRDR